MLTQPRLALFNTGGLVSRARRAAMEKMFGFYPAAAAVSLVDTRLDRKVFERYRKRTNRGSEEWSRPEMELLGAFVSARNGCVF